MCANFLLLVRSLWKKVLKRKVTFLRDEDDNTREKLKKRKGKKTRKMCKTMESVCFNILPRKNKNVPLFNLFSSSLQKQIPLFKKPGG